MKKTGIVKAAALILCAVFVFASMPLTAQAKAGNKDKTVKVGWYDSSFNTREENGRAVIDTVRRADKDMYEHKRDKKLARDTEG